MALFFARRRFRDVVRRQLALFDESNHELVAGGRLALSAAMAEPDDAASRELYEKYEDLSEDLEESLADMRDGFARTVSEELEAAYRSEFARQVKKAYGDVTPGFGPDTP